MKSLYALQPYEVGSKKSKSLVILIPSQVVKECDIDTSTVFFLRKNESTKNITLETVQELNQKITSFAMAKDLNHDHNLDK